MSKAGRVLTAHSCPHEAFSPRQGEPTVPRAKKDTLHRPQVNRGTSFLHDFLLHCPSTHTHVHILTCTYAYVYTVHIHAEAPSHAHVCAPLCAHTHMHTCIHMHTCVRTCTCTVSHTYTHPKLLELDLV